MLKTNGSNAANPFLSLVATQQFFTISELELECGQTLRDFPVAYKTWGTLNRTRDNVLLVCHALTGSADAEDWWGPLFGKGNIFDPSVFFILCINVLGSPYGTVSPLSWCKERSRIYGRDFPRVTVRDNVRLQKMVLERLQVNQVQAAIGGSMGGMLVLEWSLLAPSFILTVIAIATSGCQSAWCYGWNHIQKQCIHADPLFLAGHYELDKAPVGGLGLARIQALMTYRSHFSFEKRFGGRQLSALNSECCHDSHGYLRHQAAKFTKRFDANCYLVLLDMTDTHDVSRDRGDFTNVLKSINQPALIIGVKSDSLFPVSEQEILAENMPNASIAYVESDEGHDGFLLEFQQLANSIRGFLRRHLPESLLEKWTTSDDDKISLRPREEGFVSLVGE